jgi:ribosomal protein S14
MSDEPVRKQIDEDRAAVLLGLSRTQLRELAEQSGMGPETADGETGKKFFTYLELCRFCRSVRPAL